jgi:3-deoxy-D-manno-octulosonate 8-phosphate phosphatase (KDO 8-P phosphatase)
LSDRNKAIDKAASIQLVVFDIDGVMTDGRLIYSDKQEEYKIFHVHDGLGLQMLKKAGHEVAVISSRTSNAVLHRMKELGITRISQGQSNKASCLAELMLELNLERTAVAYVGDDLVDIPAMEVSGLAVAVANAHPFVKKHADWVTEKSGGDGAVREVCELILSAQGLLESMYTAYKH